MNLENDVELLRAIARVGQSHSGDPDISQVEIFGHYFDEEAHIQADHLDDRDGSATRRELITRFLLLNTVLDQGPDLKGVRLLLINVTNLLYQNEVRFLHTPSEFFRELGIAIDKIIEQHESVKKIRAQIWAKANQSTPGRYSLFLDGTRQSLCYAVFRWGVPLALPLLLERHEQDEELRPSVLVNYLDSHKSAECMSGRLKDHDKYGLGKAIGNKGAHVFAKWYVTSFHLTKNQNNAWGPFSFEVPFDSNAGRVLWRTGFFLHWATVEDYTKKKVVQPGAGKGGTNYLRITNIRQMRVGEELISGEIRDSYLELCTEHLRTHKKAPKKIEMQRILHCILINLYSDTHLGPRELDDGLIYIGTNFCFNHENPNCQECPIAENCEGHLRRPELIRNYRT